MVVRLRQAPAVEPARRGAGAQLAHHDGALARRRHAVLLQDGVLDDGVEDARRRNGDDDASDEADEHADGAELGQPEGQLDADEEAGEDAEQDGPAARQDELLGALALGLAPAAAAVAVVVGGVDAGILAYVGAAIFDAGGDEVRAVGGAGAVWNRQCSGRG